MAINKKIISGIIAFSFICTFTKPVFAYLSKNTDIDDSRNTYCQSITMYGSEGGAVFDCSNQGYRITLLDNDMPLYILDLVNKYPSLPDPSKCDGSYGFETDYSFNLDNHELSEIFEGCIFADNCALYNDDFTRGVRCCVEGYGVHYNPNPEKSYYDGYNEDGDFVENMYGDYYYFSDTYKKSDLYTNGTYSDWAFTTNKASAIRLNYTDDYVVPYQQPTVNTLKGQADSLFNKMQEIKGQCKLYYIDNVNNRYLDQGFDLTGATVKNPSSVVFSDNYRCDYKKIITLDELNANYGTSIPLATYDYGSSDFFLLSIEHIANTPIRSSFYDKKYINDFRTLNAIYHCIMDNMKNAGLMFDINKLSEYSLMFEPIIWIYETGVNGYYAVGDSTKGGECGWNGNWNAGHDVALQHGSEPSFAFYGTFTELAFIQSTSQCNGNYGGYSVANDMKTWKQVIGFVGKELRQFGSYDAPRMRYDSGALLWSLMDIGNCCGMSMMLRSEALDFGGKHIKMSSDFMNEESSLTYSNFYSFTGCDDSKLYQSSYLVENIGVAILHYNPPIEYFAQNYTYRTNTDVVTSIKITNNGKEDFLPSYESVSAYAVNPTFAPEPVAIGAILEYADENDNPLSAAKISELGLPDFVSVQGVGSETHNSERTGVFITTPANETYLYFKWKTSDTPMKLKVTARFVGDNNKTPIYINHSVGSINGENLEYSGGNPAYQGKTFTTVTFTCDIQNTMEKINENNVPPDAISGFMDMPSETSTAAEQELYAKNVEIFNNFDSTRLFNMQDYLNDPANESETVSRLVWFEYRAYLDSGDLKNPVKLQMKEFRADSWMQQQVFTQAWTSGGRNPIVTFDNVPQEIKSAPNGKIYKYIPSGYGFTYGFEEDYQGRNRDGIFGFNVADEDKETVKNACTMFQNGVMLFPEFNYSTDYIRTIESCGYEWFDGDLETYDSVHALSHNENSLYTKVEVETINDDNGGLNLLKSRIHFIPVWFPDDTEYNIEVIMFDYWTPAGQIYDHKTYTLYIDGNIYDNWYPTKSDANQKK